MAACKRNKQINKHTTIFNCLTRTKLMMESSADSIAVAAPTFYQDFCNETSLHGLKHTVQPKLHFLERVLWIVLTVSAFGGAVFCALSQLSRYTQEPVVVSLQRDYRRWKTIFPAVTACFLDRMDPEKTADAIEFYWNVTEDSDPERFQYYSEFIELVSDLSFRENLQNFWKYQSDDTVKGIDLLEMTLSVHPTNLLTIRLSQEKEMPWHPVITEVGMCFTSNSHYAEYQHMLQDVEWTPDSLLECHYLNGQCYLRIDSVANTVRYFIHSPFEIITAISNPTGEVSLGEELIIDFKAVEIQAAPSVKGLTPEQRRCRYPDEWLSNSIQAYSFALCQMHCRSRMAIMFCGCRPYFYIKEDGDVCDAHGMACIGRNVEILINIPKNIAKCACLPQCTEINYYSHTKKVVARVKMTDKLFPANMNLNTSNAPPIAALRVNMLPPKLRLHRDVIFTLEDLFASLGGTTALFVGASVLTVVETVLFVIRRLAGAVLTSIYKRFNKIQYIP